MEALVYTLPQTTSDGPTSYPARCQGSRGDLIALPLLQ